MSSNTLFEISSLRCTAILLVTHICGDIDRMWCLLFRAAALMSTPVNCSHPRDFIMHTISSFIEYSAPPPPPAEVAAKIIAELESRCPDSCLLPHPEGGFESRTVPRRQTGPGFSPACPGNCSRRYHCQVSVIRLPIFVSFTKTLSPQSFCMFRRLCSWYCPCYR